MAIGIDEFDDDFDEFEEQQLDNQELNNDDQVVQNDEDIDIISELLKSKGIKDSSKIKYETDNGEVEEVDWNSLSAQEQLNILRSENNSSTNDELDDAEIDFINTIRNSKMSPQEYINYVQNRGIQQYLQNNQVAQYSYQIDDISDDELYIADIISKIGEENISEQELENLLENAKSNETLFKKQVDAIRNEYRSIENNNRIQETEMQRQQQIQQYNVFAESVENEIRSFTDFCGYDLNMDESEMEELYDFITGFDEAGVSVFGKCLNDPETLVKMGWFALNGERAIQDINDYWTNEIKNVRENSYKKGIEDAKNNNVKIEIKPNKQSNNSDDELDDDF